MFIRDRTNVVLDFVLIRYLHMDVYGAALATVISQALSFVMGIVYFRSKKHIVTFSPKEWKIDKKSAGDLIRIGLPAALQQVSVNISNLTLNGIVNTYGLAATAAYGIGVKLDSFAILPCNAVSDAVATISSQNLGVGKEERARGAIKKAERITLIFNAVLTVFIFAFAPNLASIFNADPQVIDTASHYLRITVFMYMFYAYLYPISGFVKGSGNSMFTLRNSLFSQYVIRIPLAFLFAKGLGLGIYGVALAWLTAPMYSSVSHTVYYKSEKWKENLKRRQAHGLGV